MFAFARIAGSRWIDLKASEIEWGDYAQFCFPAVSLSQGEFYAISNRLFQLLIAKELRAARIGYRPSRCHFSPLQKTLQSGLWLRLALASVSSREETCAYVVESLAAEIFLPFERQSVWIVDPMFLNAELISSISCSQRTRAAHHCFWRVCALLEPRCRLLPKATSAAIHNPKVFA